MVDRLLMNINQRVDGTIDTVTEEAESFKAGNDFEILFTRTILEYQECPKKQL